MIHRGWESIEEKKTRLLEEVTAGLADEEFDLLEATLKVEAKYRHLSRIPRKAIRSDLLNAVERIIE